MSATLASFCRSALALEPAPAGWVQGEVKGRRSGIERAREFGLEFTCLVGQQRELAAAAALITAGLLPQPGPTERAAQRGHWTYTWPAAHRLNLSAQPTGGAEVS